MPTILIQHPDVNIRRHFKDALEMAQCGVAVDCRDAISPAMLNGDRLGQVLLLFYFSRERRLHYTCLDYRPSSLQVFPIVFLPGGRLVDLQFYTRYAKL